ncbi:citrate synthase [Pyrus ussuriensis x Pyrus communis]|uniref:Ubiquinone biosynthesis O-methyltransferase, mitochondrial n=1 Tax=Pyrus ussuriensis x Pyrus communis TaxID=2448454 RepID=A0A5N5GJG4_9ROSA|nr:citrate synthase [Pyrus ussuriensis x Pyrus communis]
MAVALKLLKQLRAPHTTSTILHRNLSPRLSGIHSATRLFSDAPPLTEPLPAPPPLNPRSPSPSSLNQYELAKFAAVAETWWDSEGPFKPLHMLNPTRLAFIRSTLCRHFGRDPLSPKPFEGLKFIDVGCGGGILSEPLARMGATVTGVDAVEKNINIARVHADLDPVTSRIDYQCTTAEKLVEEQKNFDAVFALEVIEHVADPTEFCKSLSALTIPGGATVVSTINRSMRAYATAIVAAEYILRWLPKGTHQWSSFLTPEELALILELASISVQEMAGIEYNPLTGRWSLSDDPYELGPALEPHCASAHVPPPGNLRGPLTIVDERTGKRYQVQVSEEGTVKATDLKKITTGKNDKGLKVYDPGYLNTAPVRSSICYIDGDEGILRYRGYPIEELAESSTFLEVAYLLMYGNLPSESQYADWEFAVSQHSAVPQGILDIIQAIPHDAHPMGVLVSAMSALSVFHPDANPALRGQEIYKSKQVRDKQIARILGKAPTIAAAAYLRLAGRPAVLPANNLSYSENFLYMLDSLGNRSYKPNPRLARVLDVLFILHAEHEMNCSTAAARHLASSGVDVYTALAGATGALYGPLHGGANEAVLKMLNEIGTVENIPNFIEGVKNRKRKMSGFGHRVYKNYDPRAKVIRKLAEEVFSIVGRDPLIEVAVALEKAALSDEYFVKRKLYPNVDFYSGLIYRAMGFPTEFFPVLFAIPRMAGWLAHWRESLDDPDTKIMRPQQVYTGNWLRHYIPPRERIVTSDADKLSQVSVSNASRRRLAGSGV